VYELHIELVWAWGGKFNNEEKGHRLLNGSTIWVGMLPLSNNCYGHVRIWGQVYIIFTSKRKAMQG
jgi:hypothetical protein